MHGNSVHTTKEKIEPHRRGAKGEFQAVKDDYRLDFIQRGSERVGGVKGAKSSAGMRAALKQLGVDGHLNDTVTRQKVAPLISVLHVQPEEPISIREAKLAEWETMLQRKDQRRFIVPSTMQQLLQWVDKGQPGSWCLYWEGYLAYDVGVERRDKGGTNGDYPATLVQAVTWRGYKGGRVELYCKRIGMAHYRYWAKRVNDLPTEHRRIPAAKAPSSE